MLKEHEKFISFVLLGAALVGLAVMVYLKPPSPAVVQNGAALAILNTIVGALVLAFGGAANALFKISSSDKKEIGEATATALTSGPPVPTTVEQPPDQPVPAEITNAEIASNATLAKDEEIPEYAKP